MFEVYLKKFCNLFLYKFTANTLKSLEYLIV